MLNVERKRSAFTLVELLAVVGIVAVLLGVLLPAVAGARASARSVACVSNLRQMGVAATAYCAANQGKFPPAYWTEVKAPLVISRCWDYTSTRDTATKSDTVTPGYLWQGGEMGAVQQCPEFDGKSNTKSDPYTGYNYNTSFIGHGQKESVVEPMGLEQVMHPDRCALFGDGQYAGGANKFMRAPFPNAGDAGFTDRAAGTQGFRHRGKTNVAFVDGHVEGLAERHVATTAEEAGKIAAGTGFLSEDNSLYSPD